MRGKGKREGRKKDIKNYRLVYISGSLHSCSKEVIPIVIIPNVNNSFPSYMNKFGSLVVNRLSSQDMRSTLLPSKIKIEGYIKVYLLFILCNIKFHK